MPISIRSRLLVLAMAPVIALAAVLFFTFTYQTQSLVDEQMRTAETRVSEVKRAELKGLMDMAYTSIKHIYENGGSLEEALPILRDLQFGQNGYIFGYRDNGERVLLGQSDKGLGENLWDLQDSKGNYLVRGLVNAAKTGDGYYTYWFPKPGQEEASPKQSYSIFLDRWGVMIGTGFYFDDVDAVLAELRSKGDEELSKSVTAILLITLVAVIATAIIGLGFSLTIIRPLSKITDSVRALSSGDADLTARVSVNDRFELGQLAEHINTFIKLLADLIQDVKSNARLTHQNAETISGHTDALATLVNEQDAETDQVATAVTEMTSAASEISSSAASAANSAAEANQETGNAKGIISNAAAEMNALNNDIGSSAYEVEELGKGVEGINSVIEVINTIADQTNLLALNAAIEAARAGEHGRGFSVVADEVRSLARKTQSSTEEIDEMIRNLSSRASAAVSSIRTSSERSSKALSANTEAVEAIDRVVEAIGQITQMNEQVAAASEEQSSVCEDITKRLVTISDKSKETSEKGRESNVSANTLLGNADGLQKLAGRFRTS
ncbi:HAMP domain-containing protein [Marinobacter salinexigens]|uniref:HAMP domain-containing protein n=1 Tax=Marinobacter salinexigens TaxID=2919747 RepID=A0A5B0VLM4_9GAMM|nr:methyl-accepting chemotaxis protein [Marinobacter salinexigens]KAA1175025.1 HAMP domain-containing protein [Marinobacter salinexigens]